MGVYCEDSGAAAEVEAVADAKADADIEVALGENVDPGLDTDVAADPEAEADVEAGPDGDTAVDTGRDRKADSEAEERRCGVAGSIFDTLTAIRAGDGGTDADVEAGAVAGTRTGVLGRKLEGGGCTSVRELGLEVGLEAGA